MLLYWLLCREFFIFFFFKQKTAYEMRISDWSSDVCSSDLLGDTVIREATTMRRQVDHHLARARAVGRRGAAHSRAEVWASLEAVERAVQRLYPEVRIDMDGDKEAAVRVERQDLDEMLVHLVENAAKYDRKSPRLNSSH